MKENFTLQPEALALKELGFEEECFGLFRGSSLEFKKHTGGCYDNNWINNFKEPQICTAILYQQAFKWFRDKHQLYHEIQVDQTTEPKFCFKISEFIGNPNDLTEREWGWENIPSDDSWGLYRKYEEAELACLKKLIELVKEKYEI
jgi:hypothetical protein